MVNRLRALNTQKEEDEITIRNPEYMMTSMLQDQLLKQKDEEVSKDFQDMVVMAQKVSQRMAQLKQRVKILTKATTVVDSDEDSFKTENTEEEKDDEFDRHAKMEILDDLITDAQKTKNAAKHGYHITPK